MDAAKQEDIILSPKELAAMIDCHVNSVYNWINDGLPVKRTCPNGRIIISYAEFKRWRSDCGKL